MLTALDDKHAHLHANFCQHVKFNIILKTHISYNFGPVAKDD